MIGCLYMHKKPIITIAGSLGSGKSSTANRIAEILGYSRASTGDFSRAIADSRGISLGELNALAETDPSIDIELDNLNRSVGEKQNVVLDSRLGFYFVPDSFKVFLKVDPSVAAERILNDAKVNPNRQKEVLGGFDSAESVIKGITERRASEKKRYQEAYGIADNTAPENFDLVIDTAVMPLEEVAQKIVLAYNNWRAS
jgi:cytidylate kinase